MDSREFKDGLPTTKPEESFDVSLGMEALRITGLPGEENQPNIIIEDQYLADLNVSENSPIVCNNPVSNILPTASTEGTSQYNPLTEFYPQNLSPAGASGSNENSVTVKKSNFNFWCNNYWNFDVWNDKSKSEDFVPMASCYSTLSSQTFGNIFFFVEIEPNWGNFTAMKTTILDPNNCQIPYEMTKENVPFSHRYICTFQAQLPGIYTVVVRHSVLNFHFKGSPLTIPVSRNYKCYSSWMAPRQFADYACKARGIAHSLLAARVYVTDRESHQVIIYHENGNVEKCFGSRGSNPGELYRPTGIAVDNHNHRLVISDKDNHRVCIYNLDGEFLFTFGRIGFRNGEFNFPWGVSVSPKDGTIAVADSGNHRLQLFDSNGNFLRKYSVLESNPYQYQTEFDCPRGITFDKTGENIYVTDFNLHSICKLNIDLTERMNIAPHGVYLNRPQGIAVDAVGNFLICDTRNNCIRVLHSNGEHISSIIGSSTSFFNPQELIVVPTGEIIILDSSSRIRVM